MPVATSTAEKELGRIERRIQNRPVIKFTPQAIARLNKLEAQLQAKARTNKNLQIAFGETKNFFSELNKLSPEDRKSKLSAIRQAAEDEFKDFFEKKRTDLQEDVATQLQRLNEDIGFADEDTMAAFQNKIAGLDRDTVEAIGEAFRSVINRGLGASGAMKAMADKIINQREIVADQVTEIRDRSLRDIRVRGGRREGDLFKAEERGIEKIGQDELFTTKLEEARLQDRESNIILQAGDITGQNVLSPREVTEPATPEIEPEPVSTPEDPASVRVAGLGEEQPNEPADILQNRVQKRRETRIARRNLAASAVT